MRVIFAAALVALKQNLLSKFYFLLAFVQPLFFFILTGVLSGGAKAGEVRAMAGCTVMGMWSVILFGAGRALLRERRFATLEYLLASPPGILKSVTGTCTGAAALGVIPAVTIAVAAVVAGFWVPVTHILLSLSLIPLVMLGLVAQGMLLCATFVLTRQAVAFSNALEYPVWFACGLLVPLSSRPAWAAVIGDLLTPTYAAASLRTALATGSVPWGTLLALLALSAAQFGLAVALFEVITNRVRRRGDITAI